MRSSLRLLAIVIASFLFASAWSAQSTESRSVTIANSEVQTMKSTSTGRTYDLYIHKPAGFDENKNKKYPVLYLLDGQWDFKLIDSVVGGLFYDKWIPDIVVVGITYNGEHPDYNSLRAMDCTPTPGQQKGSGDAPKFLNFIKSELMPLVEKDYRGDPTRRILAGQSFGGLFTLYTMFTEPTLFWGYLAGSPDFLWDNDFLVKQEANFSAKHKDLPVRLYIGVGGAEELVTPGVSFIRTLASRNYTGLHWDGRVIEGERHSGMKPEFFNRGLRFMFSAQ